MDEVSLRDHDVSWTTTDNGAVVVLDMRTSKYFELNGTGALLWSALANRVGRADLSDQLVERYGVEPDRAGADVDAFLDQLGALGLLRDPA